MTQEGILSMEESKKSGIIEETLEGRRTVTTAAGILHLSERQIYRLRQCIQLEGPQDIIHGNCSYNPNHTIPVPVGNQVIVLYIKYYENFNFKHSSEELEKITTFISVMKLHDAG